MRLSPILPLILVLASAAVADARADATIPTKDIPGAKDSPFLKRYDGSFIVSYDHLAYTDFRVPLSPLVETNRTDGRNNTLFLPKQQTELEGDRTRLVYVLPANRSPLEVLRNYQDEITAKGGEVLFSCKAEECGGDAHRAAAGGGGDSSLTQYFFYEADLKDEAFSNGACALTRPISDQRFLAARVPQGAGDGYVTVQTYQLHDDTYCKALNARTVAIVHVLLPEARDRKMTVVQADEMASAIDTTGRVALYGILFDTDKTALKPESDLTLDQIAAMMKAEPALTVLVVGHTDNAGAFDYNLDLSRRRAEAVVQALTGQYGIPAARLRSTGVGMAAPTASNDND